MRPCFNFHKRCFIALTVAMVLLSNITVLAQSDKNIFKQRRDYFMNEMGNGIAIFISPEVSNRNDDVDYKYRQSSDFYYLTGFEEPESAFILSPGSKNQFIMFVKQKDAMTEMWTGGITGIDGAMEKYGADTAFAYNDFYDFINYYFYGKDIIYYDLNNEKLNKKIAEVMSYSWGRFPTTITNPSKIVHTMRIIKSQKEIDLIQKAIDVTADAYIEALKSTEPGKYEYEIKALIEYVFAKNNCPREGFPSIVASGPNSTVLHYEKQNRRMNDGDLLLMDIGAEYGYYSADVTRTIPVNGKFSKEQAQLYEIVLNIQELGIGMLNKGVGIQKVTGAMTEMAKKELYKVGLITDENSEWQWRLWYFPYTCHWLGLDVHDAQGSVEKNKDGVILKPGMITTIEPGLYINPENLKNIQTFLHAYRVEAPDEEILDFIERVKPVVQKYANIGIRIEDDILITEDGNVVLSKKAPKKIHDIETTMNN